MSFVFVTPQVTLARNAGALYNYGLGNALMTSLASQSDINGLLNNVYVSSVGSAPVAQVASVLVANLGITGAAAVAEATAYVVGQLTPVAVAGRGKVINDILIAFSGLTGNATYGSFATAFNTKVAAAVSYANTAGSADTTFTDASTVVVKPQTFTLTAGIDAIANFTGGAKDDTFVGNTSAGVLTLTSLDAIDGGAGNDLLNISVVGDIDTVAAANSSVKNIETAIFSAGGSITTNTSAWTGLTSLTAVNSKNLTITAATTTDVTATTTDVSAGTGDEISVNGGKVVTITSGESFALVSGGGTSASIAVGGTTAAAGAVSVAHVEAVTVPALTAAHTGTGTTVTVTGGTDVTVSSTASVGAGAGGDDVFTTGAISVTGNASTSKVTVTQSAAVAASGTTTGITAGGVTVADGNAATAADTIATVVLREYGASTITSTVLSNLTLNGAASNALAGAVVINQSAADTSTAATVLNLTLEGGHTGAISGTQSDVYKTVNINSSAATTVTSASFAAATALNFTGSAATTVSAHTLTALPVITVTGAGGVTMTGALATGIQFTGGAGADSVSLSSGFTKAIVMGDGDDTVTYAGAAGTGGSVSAGLGTDTIIMTASDAASADDNSTFNSKFTGFEVLELGASGANTIVLAGINGVNSVTTGGATGALVLDGFSTGGTLKLNADVGGGGSYSAQVTNALFSAADTFNINLSKSSGVLAAGSVTVAGVETVNISAPDAASAGSAAVIHTATLVATSATTVNVSGNNGLTLTNTGNTAITKFDASGVVSNGTADTTANLAVSFTSANTTTTANVTITGGAGADVLIGNAAKDVMNGGAGADILRGGLGQDTITLGSGHDVVRVVSDADTTAGAYTDSSTAAADIVNGYVLSSAISTSVDFSTGALFRASTAGGSNLSMLSIDLNSDDGGGGAGTNLAVAIEANGTGTGQAAGTTYTVTNGILTLSGSGAANVDTLAEWLTEATAVSATAGETIGFVFGADTYVFSQNAAVDVLVQLVGVSATSLVLASSTTTASAGAVIIGDSL